MKRLVSVYLIFSLLFLPSLPVAAVSVPTDVKIKQENNRYCLYDKSSNKQLIPCEYDEMKKLTKESQISEYFDFYRKKVLPYVEKYATQKKEGYHGLYTHTDAVVFRAIDYALELGENPMPVLFAAACHDMARTHDGYDEEHGKRAIPLARKIMNRFPKRLSDTELQAYTADGPLTYYVTDDGILTVMTSGYLQQKAAERNASQK